MLQDRFSDHKSPKKKIFDLKQKGYLKQITRGQYFNTKSKDIETKMSIKFEVDTTPPQGFETEVKTALFICGKNACRPL